MIVRVSTVEAFRQWRDDEEAELASMLAKLRGENEPSELMLAGTAFHTALENAQEGDTDVLQAEGYTFTIECDGVLALPQTRELRASKDYGPLTVTGKVDIIEGKRVEDHKTTGSFDPERFIAGYQWRFYLDIFGADTFRWNVFEISAMPDREKKKRKLDGKVYRVHDLHTLEQHRYPGLHDDCAKLAADLHEFMLEQLPEQLEAA